MEVGRAGSRHADDEEGGGGGGGGGDVGLEGRGGLEVFVDAEFGDEAAEEEGADGEVSDGRVGEVVDEIDDEAEFILVIVVAEIIVTATFCRSFLFQRFECQRFEFVQQLEFLHRS